MSTPEERYAAGAAAIAPYGFVTQRAHPDALRRWLPLSAFATPERCTVVARGVVERAPVLLCEYEYTSHDSEGTVSTCTQLLALVEHPWVVGGALITLDWKQWSSFAAALDVLFWIPPFTVVKALQYLDAHTNPDRVVGHREFDRLYHVRAASEDDARRAITPALGDFLVRHRFEGALELRPGLMIFALAGACFDGQGAPRMLSFVPGLLRSFEAPSSGHPLR